jgi:hypothetical protein
MVFTWFSPGCSPGFHILQAKHFSSFHPSSSPQPLPQVQIAALRQYEAEFDSKVTEMLYERDEARKTHRAFSG